MKKAFLFLALAFAATSASAREFMYEGINYNLDDATMTATVIWKREYQSMGPFGVYHNTYDGFVNIPETIGPNGEYTVTAIGDQAFANLYNDEKSIYEVAIPKTVKTIGSSAFEGCSKLRVFTVKANIEKIGASAFNNTGIQQMTIEDSDTPLTIGWRGYSTGSLLTGMNNCATIYVGRDITCEVLTTTNSTFSFCDNLWLVTYGPKVTKLNERECWRSTSIQQVKMLSDKITYIPTLAFAECSHLHSLELGKSVSQIADDAFNGCTAMMNLYVHAKTPPELNSIGGIDPTKCWLHIPEGTEDLYRQWENSWGRFLVIKTFKEEDTEEPTEDSTPICPDGNHPHFVDLGLPSGLKWACCNIGATTPEAPGDHFQWGETAPEQEYTDRSNQYYYQNIGTDIAGTKYDAAHVNWGNGWVMPTAAQVEEMVALCAAKDTVINDSPGRLFTAQNGNCIFLPFTGWAKEGEVHEQEIGGVYWTSEVYSGRDARYFDHKGNTTQLSGSQCHWSRSDGLAVRAVCAETAVKSDICPDDNHPHFVDLGLPSGLKWACCNIGATAPEAPGDHFQWGETAPEQEYTDQSNQYYYQNIGSDIAGTEYDAAHVNWGNGWVMPTVAQVDEMVALCAAKDTVINDSPGRLFTAQNGNCIFLPFTGWAKEGEVHELEMGGVYWTSEVYSGRDAHYFDHNGYTTQLSGSQRHWSRSDGLAVRAVCAETAVNGDVNGDEAVDVSDIASVISVMAGSTTIAYSAADVNGDGSVDVADIATIISIMASIK